MFGERLQELRKDKGWSQKDLASMLSLSWRTVSSYETDKSKPNDEILVRIAKLFDISLDYLLGLIDEQISYKRPRNTIYLPKELPKESENIIADFVKFIELRNDGFFKK